MEMEALVKAVTEAIFIPLEASGRHVHVTEAQAMQLFGHPLTPKRPLSQPGQYLAQERVRVVGPKGSFENVAVLGPARKAAQVEISLTDGRNLGIVPPVRLSGDVSGTPGAMLEGRKGKVEIGQGVIVAQRHIHMRPADAARMGVRDGESGRLRTYTQRPVVLEAGTVRVSPDFATYAHLDYVEANACGFREGDLGRIVP